MNNKPKVLVAGATGYLGGFVLSCLMERGNEVYAISRSKGKARFIEPNCTEVFIGDVTDKNSIKGFCDNIDVVISSVGLRTANPRPTFEEVDFGANINLLNEAISSKVDHFIFVSVLMGDKRRQEIASMNARERVVDAIKKSSLPKYTIARPNGFFNDMEGMFEMASGGKFLLVGNGDTKINPIHGEDLAIELVNSIEDESRWNQEFDIGGPEVYTMKEIGSMAFEFLDKAPSYFSVNPKLLRFLSVACQLFNKNAASLLKALAILGSEKEMLAPKYGKHSLRAFYQELSEQQLRQSLKASK